MSPMSEAALARLLRHAETMNVSGTEAHWALIPPELARRLRAQVQRIGDGILTLMETSDALRMNQAVGLGHRGQATEGVIDEIIARYRSSRVGRFRIMVTPGPQAEAIEATKSRSARPSARQP